MATSISTSFSSHISFISDRPFIQKATFLLPRDTLRTSKVQLNVNLKGSCVYARQTVLRTPVLKNFGRLLGKRLHYKAAAIGPSSGSPNKFSGSDEEESSGYEDQGKVASIDVNGEGKVVTQTFRQPEPATDPTAPAPTVTEEIAETSNDIIGTTEATVNEVQESVQEIGGTVQSTVESVSEDVEDAATSISKSASDALEDTRKGLEGSGQQARDALENAGSEVRQSGQNLQARAEGAVSELAEQGETLNRRTAPARSRIEEQGEVTVKIIQDAADSVAQQTEAAAATLGGAVLQAVGESVKAAGDFGEVFKSSAEEILSDISGQAEAISGRVSEETRAPDRPSGKELAKATYSAAEGGSQSVSAYDDYATSGTIPPRKPDGSKKGNFSSGTAVQGEGKGEADESYAGLKAFVAGSNGKTGRLIVEKLVAKGVPVRALVRNARKETSFSRLSGVEVVEGDLYKYETLKKAIGDSNVIISAAGVRPEIGDPFGPFKEYEGVKNLVALAKNTKGTKKIVLVTSLGVSFLLFPLNLFWGILFWKKQQELEVQRSGLAYTIVRPGGLKSVKPSSSSAVIMRPPDTLFGGSITRSQVADVCIESLISPEASDKIVEVIAKDNMPAKPLKDQFSSL